MELEIGLREYLLILGAILIVGLLADGIRRTLRHKREGLKLDLMAAPPESPERSDVSKPRSARKTMPVDLEPKVDADPLFDPSHFSQLNLWAGEIKAEAMKSTDREALDVEFAKDTLTESLFAGNEPIESQESSNSAVTPPDTSALDRMEPTWIPDNSVPIKLSQPAENLLDSKGNENAENTASSEDNFISDLENDIHSTDMQILGDGPMVEPITKEEEASFLSSTLGRIFSHFGKKSEYSDGQKTESPSLHLDHGTTEKPSASIARVDTLNDQSMYDLILVRVQSSREERLEGVNLHKACWRAGLRRSKSKIYQRFPLDETEHPLFSLVNGIEPGIFEDDAKSIDTPVVFLFTELPKQSDPLFAVNELISGARSIARDIGCDVFDQGGTPISKDWIDFARAQASYQNLTRT